MRSLLLVSPFVLGVLLSGPPERNSVMALPGPFPMPFRNADYGAHLASLPHATRRHALETSQLRSTAEHSSAAPSKQKMGGSVNASSMNLAYTSGVHYHASRAFRRDFSNRDVLLEALSGHRDGAMADSQELQSMASQSASQNEDDAAYQRNVTEKFSSSRDHAQAAGNILGQLAADKGLANYDKNDQLETIIKEFVNANKDALSVVDTMINNDPELGPILGPIVYDIKCLVDEILDATENITDGLLNDLKPLLPGTGIV